VADFPDPAWLESFQARVNADPEMEIVGGWFTCRVSLAFGDQRYLLRIEKGRIIEIITAPGLDQPSNFGFRAPLDVWRRFLRPAPPPLYHDIFAMIMRVPEFVLEGDTLVAMQNARALQRMMNLMR
jgi:hypothetical protein